MTRPSLLFDLCCCYLLLVFSGLSSPLEISLLRPFVKFTLLVQPILWVRTFLNLNYSLNLL